MRATIIMLVLATVLVGGTLMWELAYNDYVEQAAAAAADNAELACSQIEALIGTFANAPAQRSSAMVRDARSASDHHGCRIDLAVRDVALIAGHWPHEAIRQRLAAERWREDIGHAADGPGSTAFALRRASVTCLFAASWTLSDWADPEPVANEYRFAVGCFRSAAAGDGDQLH